VTVAILGGGQLGQMLAQAGLRLERRCRVLEPDANCPAASVAEVVVGAYDDPAALARLVDGTAVATYEFENVPRSAAAWIEANGPSASGRDDFFGLRPGARSLEVAQDRVNEKNFFAECGLPVQPFAAIATPSDLDDAMALVGVPAVLKTRRFGYDGKGQRRIRDVDTIGEAWGALGGGPCILESMVPFAREVSVVAVRNAAGEVRCWPLVENRHVDGILAESRVPATDAATLERTAQRHVATLAARLGHVGVLAVEFFVVQDEDDGVALVTNEMAPRVHNSGHWTIDGAQTSQFENHLRAILDLPLGGVDALGPCTMINLVGAVPDIAALREIPDAHVHLYGKTPRAGRKLGHVTILGDRPDVVDQVRRMTWDASSASAR